MLEYQYIECGLLVVIVFHLSHSLVTNGVQENTLGMTSTKRSDGLTPTKALQFL